MLMPASSPFARRVPFAWLALVLAVAAAIAGCAWDSEDDEAGRQGTTTTRDDAEPGSGAGADADNEPSALTAESRGRLAEELAGFVAELPQPSCLVVSAAGEPVVAHNAEAPLIPASSQKLLLAAAALNVLGPDELIPAPGGTEAPVGSLVEAMLGPSSNDAGSHVLAAMAREFSGTESAQEGGQAVLDVLSAQGIVVDGLRMVDGSGLDRSNRASCRALHSVLSAAPGDGPLDSGLAVAGRSGTLEDRLDQPPVAGRLRAKTGQIRGVAALAGYVDGDPGDRAIIFASIFNGVDSIEHGEMLHERLAVILAGAAADG